MIIMTTIECIRGDSKSIQVTITENSVAKDITGVDVVFTVKEKLDQDNTDAEAIIQKTCNTGTALGIASFVLSKDDTEIDDGSYYYNVRLINSGEVLSSKNGKFNVILGATQKND
jgi:hypothetical protein